MVIMHLIKYYCHLCLFMHVNVLLCYVVILHSYAGLGIVYFGKFFKTSSPDIVNDIWTHAGFKNVDE